VLGTWVEQVDDLALEFERATPFPLVVIDDFLQAELADALLAEFPDIEGMERSHDYVFGDKKVSQELSAAGATAKRLRDFLISDDFAALLARLTGRKLFLDPEFHGGGFHQGGDGSFLDTHVDFNVHPDHGDWLRVLNILLYLNKDWPPELGGDLLVRSDPNDEPRAIAPHFNRCVIMLTGESTYHGYRRMTLPAGRTRKSIAAYAYELVDPAGLRRRTTSWAPEESGPWKRALGRNWPRLVEMRDRLARARGNRPA
jgi:hypothetical protein